MIGQSIITFREVFEASLILGIVFAFLTKAGRSDLHPAVWMGTVIAIVSSFLIGGLVWLFMDGLSDETMKLFEGVTALIAVAVLTGMIFWMANQGHRIRHDIENKIDTSLGATSRSSVIILVFLLIFREGLETVLFLIPYSSQDPWGTMFGASGGAIIAVTLSLLIFVGGMRFDQRRFFQFTGILLILIASGLAGYGVHELLEYQEAIGSDPGWIGSYAYQMDISKDSVFHHKSSIGSFFAVMVGYSVKMEWARIIVHGTYLGTVLPLFLLKNRSMNKRS